MPGEENTGMKMLLEKGGEEMVGVGPSLCCICRGLPVFRDPLSLA